jgi:hypothetical protein
VNILENVLSADNGGVVRQLANQFGITAEQATSTNFGVTTGDCRRIERKTQQWRRAPTIEPRQQRKPKQVCRQPCELSKSSRAHPGQLHIALAFW